MSPTPSFRDLYCAQLKALRPPAPEPREPTLEDFILTVELTRVCSDGHVEMIAEYVGPVTQEGDGALAMATRRNSV